MCLHGVVLQHKDSSVFIDMLDTIFILVSEPENVGAFITNGLFWQLD
jgi:hypothetical protein